MLWQAKILSGLEDDFKQAFPDAIEITRQTGTAGPFLGVKFKRKGDKFKSVTYATPERFSALFKMIQPGCGPLRVVLLTWAPNCMMPGLVSNMDGKPCAASSIGVLRDASSARSQACP